MAPVRLMEVIVYSSQDSVHRADNLLDQSSQWKRWLCASGDRSGSMQAEFQLEKAAKIGYVDIGNYGSAFVEILVRKSSWSSNDYVTLIPATMLMSPMESRSGQNKCAVKMFTKAALSEESLRGKWDRIKVKCSQPYKKDAQFGLAFIRLRSLEEPKEQTQTISPGPTMTKLHSKSESTPMTDKPNGRPILSPSWKTNSSFQRQFMAVKDENNKYSDMELKARLLKMAATADTGSDKSDSLSRSAKMVLTSSNKKQQTPKRQPSSHGNSVHTPSTPSRKNNSTDSPYSASRKQLGPRRQDSDFENCYRSSSDRSQSSHGHSHPGHENSASKSSEPRCQRRASGQPRDSHSGFTHCQKEKEQTSTSKTPKKRPSNLPAESSPSKLTNGDSHRPFKQVAGKFLASLGRSLFDSKLSDIRPVLERKLGRKLSREEKHTLKQLAVERVDVLLKSPSTPSQPKPQPVPTTSTSQDSASSSVTDIAEMEFRNCPKCYLQFTARQITGHVLCCQGIPSAAGVAKAMDVSSTTKDPASFVPQRGRVRGRGRRGGRQRQRRSPAASEDNLPAVSSHVRTAQMPRYQREGAVAKGKCSGRATNPSSRNAASSPANSGKQQPGGFLIQPVEVSPSQHITSSPQGGKLTTQQSTSFGSSLQPSSAWPGNKCMTSNTNASLARSSFQMTPDRSDAREDTEYEETSPCPICFKSYPVEVIEIHADMCLEQTHILNEISNRQMACF
ncbi:serine/arginine repetitive matrix protein 2-like isoform X3 [Acanthaster planci]|uniref:Serine/arginine repetitive matrix protein 2-like isoform X3 n=1 Tax=Acanthaster planci TaxID=133434 RepID=A0A8B7Y179_ACAPL|nr:serine/arginine repetitive matrix protein 2-like isoform X3 [Acanthaster planci]